MALESWQHKVIMETIYSSRECILGRKGDAWEVNSVSSGTARYPLADLAGHEPPSVQPCMPPKRSLTIHLLDASAWF